MLRDPRAGSSITRKLAREEYGMGSIHNTFTDLLTEHDLARLTKRSLASVRRDRRLQKNCPFIRVGRSVRYVKSDVEDWLRSLPRHGGQRKPK
jgi:hypothetical protein